jgi:hypothetical protein
VWEEPLSSHVILVILIVFCVAMAMHDVKVGRARGRTLWQRKRNTFTRTCFTFVRIQLLEMGQKIKPMKTHSFILQQQ